MPPHMHPRSRLTSSLFATTLFASFFVVALPHILPCPAPRVAYADGEMSNGAPRRRRRRKCEGEKTEDTKDSLIEGREESGNGCEDEGSRIRTNNSKRECPVPKPGGLVGEILGFKPSKNEKEGPSRPP
ncbi:hypothetical protein HYALB_00005177 [Hymenoscyphus albidus]|uniref:Uncharacterized protein n=1 Tax=Hymenoscyphus albidus TaxID=595503 RepID=A0A9N9LX11_9HELO|nr:hypothetical protein HYALB_00005177 [Hymenoscyphus albidus]